MIFRACHFYASFPRPSLVMGVLNVTPDSFSDGGRFLEPDHALAHGLSLIEEGAEILDVGGESTRPGAQPVAEQEEMRRVIPVIERLSSQSRVPIAIDTMKPAVARAALRAGASIVNDVAAHRTDPEMWRVVAEAGAGYIAMHMRGTPTTMQEDPRYEDVAREVNDFFGTTLGRLSERGVSPEQVILDVGFGFGKTAEHNLQLLAAWRSFTKWDRPLLLGVSRKSFIGRITGEKDATHRWPGSLACACWAIQQGTSIVRTHDVAATRQALRMTEAILARQT